VPTPERAKSGTFRVTTVDRCSSAVAAIRPSLTAQGCANNSLPHASATAAVIGKIRSP
jgi:hypothetical protein